MLKGLLQLINVRTEEEERPALLLLGYGFFMGVFLATYRVVVETLFLNSLGEYLKEAFFISGILGVVSTWLYMLLQKRISFSRLAIFNLLAVFSFIIVVFLNISQQYNLVFIYILYVMLFPVTSIMLLSFWGLFGRIFDIRQSKRIIGSIDAGQLLATILAFISVPFFIQYISNVTDILIVSAISIIACFAFLIFINKEFKYTSVATEQKGGDTYRFSQFFKDNYSILLSIFIGISVICVSFVDYTFLKLTEQQYPDENSLATFLSYMYLAIMVFTLIMQTFVNDRLIGSYGLKTALMILPIILGLFTIGAIVTGNLFGYTTTSSEFIWYFLFIGLSKFFSNSLREALENPTFKIFFMPLNINIRFDIQAKVEGVINEFARLIAGTMILVIGILSFFELIHYSYFLLAIVIGYFFVTGKLYNEYRNNVRKKLESHEIENEEVKMEKVELEAITKNFHLIPDASTKIFTLKLIEKLNRKIFQNFLPSLIGNEHKIVKKFALLKLNEIRSLSGSSNPNKIKIIENTEKGKEDIGRWLNRLLHSKEDASIIETISKLTRSEMADDRMEAVSLIVSNSIDESIPYLIELINDLNYNVQAASIIATGKIKKAELYPFLIDKLSSSAYGDLAITSLVEIGDDIIPYLDVIFQKTDQASQTQLRIIKIFEKVGTEKSREILWSKIDYPDKKVVSQVLLALSNSKFQADAHQNLRIKYVIESDINDIIWNLHALDKIPHSDIGKLLRKSLKEENQSHYRHIYMLLSMIFDPYSINLIRSNIDSGTSEGITYAIELLDVLLTEDLKDRIIPLFDDISNQDKIKRLQVFYPHMLGDFHDVIKQIINKEFNQINRWSKTLALYWVGTNQDESLLYELISNLFNPDPLIRDTSAWSLYQINPQYYEENVPRIGKERKMELDLMIMGRKEKYGFSQVRPLTIDKAFFLSRLKTFRQLPRSFVVNLIDYIEEVHLHRDQKYIITEETNTYFYIIYEGFINLIRKGVVLNNLSKGEFIGEFLIETIAENEITIHPLSNVVLLRIPKEKLYELLSNDHEMALTFLDQISKNIQPEDEHMAKTA
jgi:ATP/ADP translocase/HEAT repeat protein